MVPAKTGETTQLATIDATFPQLTTSALIPTAAKPTIAPTIEWVVDTGHPKYEAISNQMPAANKAEVIP